MSLAPMRLHLLCGALIALLLGCGSSPTFDASKSDDSMKAIAAAMPADEKEGFAKAYAGFLLSRAIGKMDKPDTIANAQKELDGKTAKEMLAYFELHRAKRTDIDKAETAKKEALKAADLALLTKVSVTLVKRTPGPDSSFSFHELTLRVKNGTEHHLASVMGNFLVLEEGRQVPWVQELVSFNIPGGLKPGEEREIETGVRMPELAKEAKPTSEMVRVKDLFGPDNKPLTRSYLWDR